MAVLGHTEKNKKNIIKQIYFDIKLKKEREREKKKGTHIFLISFSNRIKSFFNLLSAFREYFLYNNFLLWQLSAIIQILRWMKK